MYRELGNRLNIPELEEEVLKYWDENGIFRKSIETRDENRPFVFYEGPPTANGRPGIHHVLARTVKDIVCRLKTMEGYRVERKAGWDTHGLPVEIEVEKELGIESKEEIIAYGVAKFNQKCKESVWRYKKEWDELTRRIAFWIDLEHPYITYENDYIETVWWILSELWKKGLMYLGHKILPYCPRCETPLSSHEVALGYKDVQDPSVYVKMQLEEDPDTAFLVWTTTPWTLISNVALALHPEVDYVKVRHNGEQLILAEPRLEVLEGEYEIIEKYKGADLAGKKYRRLFDFLPVDRDAFYTVTADFVTTEDGTGIVHIAPAFGEDDYNLGQKHDLPFLQPVDKSGNFDERVTAYAGQFVKSADRQIIRDLKAAGKLYKSETYLHSYPHCWRCDSPLLYYARASWYIRTTALKDRLIEHNNHIDWYPKEVGEGRFGEWLKNNVDWALSRDRFWGTPLPIWECDACDHKVCVGSVAELKERAGVKEIPDLHKPYVDELFFPCEKCGGRMQRVPEVIDVWFDSGSMPYAQWHYPFENKETFEKRFPADFISEGVDQTRGWFYSLLAIAVLLFDKPCYKSCISLELILDKEGQKMSKSRGNTVDPFAIIAKYGADPLRWYLMAVSPPWVPTRFDEEGVAETVRKFFGTLLNTYNFFAMYANIDGFDYHAQAPIPVEQRPEIDRWIISVKNRLVEQAGMLWRRYEITKVARAVADFVLDDLSNWYVRRNRRRFWKSEAGEDKLAAYQTLYEVLVAVSRLMAPIAPMIAELLYRNLTAGHEGMLESVHLTSYPRPQEPAFQYREEELEERMELIRDVVVTGRALRNAAGVKVRQPLPRLIVAPKTPQQRDILEQMAELICQELNVKKVEFAGDAEELMRRQAEPIFKKLGPKFGKSVNQVAGLIRNLTAEQIAALEKAGRLRVGDGEREFEVELEDVKIVAEGREGLLASLEGKLPVALDPTLTDELIAEGLAREVVNRIQNMRKEAGFDVVDRIEVAYEAGDRIAAAIQGQKEYIMKETLAEKLYPGRNGQGVARDWNIEGEKVHLEIKKIAN